VSDTTVFIVDDDPASRDPLRFLLESVELKVITFASAGEFLDAFDPQTPGCLILDVRLRGMSGLDLQAELNRRGLAVATIFLTGHADVPMAVRAMKNGAFDFLEKPFNDQELLDRVQQAIERDRNARVREAERAEQQHRLEALTPREREVMDLLVEGRANKEAADALGLSVRTIEGHRARLMEKLGANSLADLVRIRLGT
jgi:RNA polymerase sigma factor (sigma-70 family)